jgi:carboxyl-terminal processing protease
MSEYYKTLRFIGAFNAYAFDYVYNKRHYWSSFEKFNQAFTVTEALLADFTKFSLYEFGILQETIKNSKSKALFMKTLKAEIARQIWLETGYFSIMNPLDTEVQQALKNLR